MNEIIAILSTFSSKEKKELNVYLRKRNRRGDVKNLRLLQLLNQGKTKDLDLSIYGKPSRGAFHALCKRVLDTLIDFVASKSFAEETSNELETLKLLLSSRIFFEQKLYKTAFKALKRAEIKAKEIENYSILNEIYHTKMQYAFLNNDLSLEEIISDFKSNERKYRQDFQLNMAYAKIKSDLRLGKKSNINDIVIEAFSRFDLQITEDLTYKSLYQLMEITATTASIQNDFYLVTLFMMDLYDAVHRKGKVPENQKYYFLRIQYLMAITKFRNKDFSASKELILNMRAELERSKKSFGALFGNKLMVLEALNETYTGNYHKGIELLKTINKTSLNGSLVLVMCLFQQEHYQVAYKNFMELNRSDDWYTKKMGVKWVVKKNIIEILLLIELDRLELVLLRLKKFSKKYGKILIAIGEERVLTFMDLVKKYYDNPLTVTSEDFKNNVEVSFEWLGRNQEDIFVMSFYSWLKAKMEKRKLYEVTLELVNKKTN